MAHVGQRTVVVGTGVALAAGLLVGCGHEGAADTRLSEAQHAVVVTAAGRTVVARPGLALHAGDQVRTGADGSAILTTGKRTAYLGGEGTYTVRDSRAGVLSRGAFLVDARHGPALSITAGPVSVRVGQSAVRVERAFTVRVGILAGRPVAVAADPVSGPAHLALPALYQVVVAGRGLPEAGSPLVLTDDDAERRVVPDLVFDDTQLTRTASALDAGTEGRTIVRLAAAAGLFTSSGGAGRSAPTAVLPSETALPMAIARAATGPGSAAAVVRQRYQDATGLRVAGGSWGVVARLVGTDATATGRAIDGLLAGIPSAGAVLALAPAAPATGSGSGATSGGTSTGSSTSGRTGGNRSSSSGERRRIHAETSPSRRRVRRRVRCRTSSTRSSA